jgi:PIN domain nuclease of toxin-antitoxin system
VLLSIASLWELAIKLSLGRLSLVQPFDQFVRDQLAVNVIDLLDISVSHLTELTVLPFHHRDPFDRLLIAQARVERITIVSGDSIFDAYEVERLWA